MEPAGWARFKEDLTTVLSALSALPITVPATGMASAAATASTGAAGDGGAVDGGGDAMEVDDSITATISQSDTTSVKYLTSSKLFSLQVGVECGGGGRGKGLPEGALVADHEKTKEA